MEWHPAIQPTVVQASIWLQRSRAPFPELFADKRLGKLRQQLVSVGFAFEPKDIPAVKIGRVRSGQQRIKSDATRNARVYEDRFRSG
jgi:hypothetical protein